MNKLQQMDKYMLQVVIIGNILIFDLYEPRIIIMPSIYTYCLVLLYIMLELVAISKIMDIMDIGHNRRGSKWTLTRNIRDIYDIYLLTPWALYLTNIMIFLMAFSNFRKLTNVESIIYSVVAYNFIYVLLTLKYLAKFWFDRKLNTEKTHKRGVICGRLV